MTPFCLKCFKRDPIRADVQNAAICVLAVGLRQHIHGLRATVVILTEFEHILGKTNQHKHVGKRINYTEFIGAQSSNACPSGSAKYTDLAGIQA